MTRASRGDLSELARFVLRQLLAIIEINVLQFLEVVLSEGYPRAGSQNSNRMLAALTSVNCAPFHFLANFESKHCVTWKRDLRYSNFF